MNVRTWVAASLVAVAGCGGVSQEMYAARGAQIEKLQAEMAQQKTGLDGAQSKAQQCEAARQADKAAEEKRLAEAQARADRRRQQFHSLMDKLQEMVRAGKLDVEVRDGLMVVKLPAAILFDPGKVDIKPEGKQALKELSATLVGIPDRRYQIAGHTDNQPLGKGMPYADNWSLSTARAVKVVDYMIHDGGMPAGRVSAAGWADQMPVAKNDNEEGRKLNRRIEIVLQPNIDELEALAGPAEKK